MEARTYIINAFAVAIRSVSPASIQSSTYLLANRNKLI